MDVLIDLGLRALLLVLLHPLPRGLLLVLVALYGVGCGWSVWAVAGCALLSLAGLVWSLAGWVDARARRR
ncbi:hypothetical protein E7T09_00880 [Deinococcus sp. KSM4-11]|uniref:hypothetical protein n=1 Tax=Deinococcus sp. KSM4-11 TaxID=2568654 RepID=UPI0010A3C429|nr:hypothetical protein [Deinococcus sp. KSM4-11]THF87826.1 hypothetical protein E7T09_00880 [Deinococcus sp. KSM4-11]